MPAHRKTRSPATRCGAATGTTRWALLPAFADHSSVTTHKQPGFGPGIKHRPISCSAVSSFRVAQSTASAPSVKNPPPQRRVWPADLWSGRHRRIGRYCPFPRHLVTLPPSHPLTPPPRRPIPPSPCHPPTLSPGHLVTVSAPPAPPRTGHVPPRAPGWSVRPFPTTWRKPSRRRRTPIVGHGSRPAGDARRAPSVALVSISR